jgi:hypothetical protein
MKKSEAKKIFGSVKKLAQDVGYSASYFYSLPDPLPLREADRIRGAIVRLQFNCLDCPPMTYPAPASPLPLRGAHE